MSIVIDADKLWKAITTNHDDYIELGELGELIYDGEMEAPTAQKTGHWQKYEGRFDYNWECSECECSSYEKTSYCAHCGARMENES